MIVPALSAAQHPGPCASPEARAFDFWIGRWSIQQKILRQDGTWLTLPAETSVAPALDGCALIEHWEGSVEFFWEGMRAPEPIEGLSVRAYDPDTRQWSIHWMDSRSPKFGTPYVGDFAGGRGEFFREWETPQGRSRGRITFSDVTPDTVDWELAISTDGGESWSTLWKMEMSRLED